MNDITLTIKAIQEGDTSASEALLPLVYDELRKLAKFQLAGERQGQTLQATALVHEAYLKLTRNENQSWENRKHFFRSAAETMRRILIDQARKKKAIKHGGDLKRVDVQEIDLPSQIQDDRLLDMNDALSRFETIDAAKAELVKLRYFTGLKINEAAKILEISVPTANRWWNYAKAWMYREMTESDLDSGDGSNRQNQTFNSPQ